MCADADGLLKDGTQCNLAELMCSWSGHGHEERSFERPSRENQTHYSLCWLFLPCPQWLIPLVISPCVQLESPKWFLNPIAKTMLWWPAQVVCQTWSASSWRDSSTIPIWRWDGPSKTRSSKQSSSCSVAMGFTALAMWTWESTWLDYKQTPEGQLQMRSFLDYEQVQFRTPSFNHWGPQRDVNQCKRYTVGGLEPA